MTFFTLIVSGYKASMTMQYAAPLPHCSTLVYLRKDERIARLYLLGVGGAALQPEQVVEPLQTIAAPHEVRAFVQANSAHDQKLNDPTSNRNCFFGMRHAMQWQACKQRRHLPATAAAGRRWFSVVFEVF